MEVQISSGFQRDVLSGLAKLAGWVFLWCYVSPAASPSCLIVIITVKHLRVFMPYTSPVGNIIKKKEDISLCHYIE